MVKQSKPIGTIKETNVISAWGGTPTDEGNFNLHFGLRPAS
jgi:hypothetical protein